MKYTKSQNTYFAKPKDNPKDRISVEIGDSKEPDVMLPQAKICRWDNDSNVSIRLKDFDSYSVIKNKDKVIFGDEKKEVHFYQIEDGEGANEIEVVLNEKPESNVIEFTLEDKDVEYFYQPPLTQEEIDKGAIRPENVIGSYAVYAKTPKTNYVGGKEYKCGKIGHIYRPRIVDSSGTEVWGELHIENGILSVTIPQGFLDKAIYPVRHAAGLTFGYDTAGTTGTTSVIGSQGSLFTTSGQSGTVTGMSVSQDKISGPPSDTTYTGIYTHGDLTIITNGLSNSVTDSNTAKHWEDYIFGTNPSLVDSTAYLLMVDQGTGYLNFYYDTGSTNQGHTTPEKVRSTTTFNNLVISHNTNKYSIYCTYTAATVDTDDTTNITDTTARLNGNVTSDGGETITERGFYFGLSQYYTDNVQYEVSGTTGEYYYDMTGLPNNDDSPSGWYVTAYATNVGGTVVGETKHFHTLSGGGDKTVTPSALSLTSSLKAPSVLKEFSKTVAITAALALSLVLQSPSYATSDSITPATQAITTTLNAPTVVISDSLIPSAQTLILSQKAPSITIGETQTPDALALALTLNSPSYKTDDSYTPSAQQLNLSLKTVVVEKTFNKTITPNAQTLSLTLPSPSYKTNDSVTPSTQTLSLTLNSPTVLTDKRLFPNTQRLSLVSQTPTVVVSETQLPSAQQLSLSLKTPVVSFGQTPQPSAQSLSLSIPYPTITITLPCTVSPPPLQLGLTLKYPEKNALPETQTLALTLNSPSYKTDDSYTPATQTLTLAVQSPTIVRTDTETPDAQQLTLSLKTPTLQLATDKVILPSVQELTATLNAPTVVYAKQHYLIFADNRIKIFAKGVEVQSYE